MTNNQNPCLLRRGGCQELFRALSSINLQLQLFNGIHCLFLIKATDIL